MLQRCPYCGKDLWSLVDEGIVIKLCEHYTWYTSFGSIANDELVLSGGGTLRLLKR